MAEMKLKKLGPTTRLMKFMNILLRLTGQNIYYDDIYSKIITSILTGSLTFIFILGIIQPFYYPSMTALTQFIDLFGPYFQCLTKIVVHNYNMGKIRKLLREMNDNFWPSDKFGKHLEQKKKNIFRVLYYCSAFLCCGMLSCSALLLLWPLTGKRDVLFTCYQIYDYETHKAYWILIYIIEFFNALYGCVIVTAYDGLFLDFVARLLIELMLLSEGIYELNMEGIKTKDNEIEAYDKVREYVTHHDMLLRMFESVKELFSLVLFNQILASTATLCSGVYIVADGKETSLIIRGIIFTGTFLFQLSIYCVAGSMIEEQCDKVADAAFYAGWHAPCGKRLRNSVTMIIMRARRTPVLKAGNVMDANLNTFGNILQFTISFYTLINEQINK